MNFLDGIGSAILMLAFLCVAAGSCVGAGGYWIATHYDLNVSVDVVEDSARRERSDK